MGRPWTPRTPDWVTLDASQISDLHWLAYAMLVQTRLPWAAGVGAAISWIRGGRNGPITERDEQPVTRAIADAERWAAEAARDPDHAPPLGAIYAQLEVAPRPPLPGQDPNYAVGVWRALRWVLRVPGQDPPLDIPRRHPDGRVFVAADIYTDMVSGDDTHLSPEQKREIWTAADYWASQYVHTAAQIVDIQRKLADAG